MKEFDHPHRLVPGGTHDVYMSDFGTHPLVRDHDYWLQEEPEGFVLYPWSDEGPSTAYLIPRHRARTYTRRTLLERGRAAWKILRGRAR